jgi:hypothetical protein
VYAPGLKNSHAQVVGSINAWTCINATSSTFIIGYDSLQSMPFGASVCCSPVVNSCASKLSFEMASLWMLAVLQTARLQALETFRTGESLLLLATDVAARGLDILGVQAVVNYDCPRTLDTYLHRVGRTARAGAQGLAISIVEDKDRALVKAVMKHACKKLDKRELPKGVIESWRAKVESLASSIEDVLMVRAPCWRCVSHAVSHTPLLLEQLRERSAGAQQSFDPSVRAVCLNEALSM